MRRIEIEQQFDVRPPSGSPGGPSNDDIIGMFVVGAMIAGGVIGAVVGGGWGCAIGLGLGFLCCALAVGSATN